MDKAQWCLVGQKFSPQCHKKINKEQINNKYVGKPLGTFYKANESAGCLALPGYTSRF